MLADVELFVLITIRFNEKPMRGVRFLQERGLLGESSTDVAQFLYTDQRLDKVRHLVDKLLPIRQCLWKVSVFDMEMVILFAANSSNSKF